MDKKEPPYDVFRIRFRGGDNFEILEEPNPPPPPIPPKSIGFSPEIPKPPPPKSIGFSPEILNPPSPPKSIGFSPEIPNPGKIDLPSTSTPMDTCKPPEETVIEIPDDPEEKVITMETSTTNSTPSVSSLPEDKTANKKMIAKKVLVPVTIVRPSCSSMNIPHILYVKEKIIYTTEGDSPDSETNENFISPSNFLKQFDRPIAIRKYPEVLPEDEDEQSKSDCQKCHKCGKHHKRAHSLDRKTSENDEDCEEDSTSCAMDDSQPGPSSQCGKETDFKVPAVPTSSGSNPNPVKRKRRVSNLPYTGDIYTMETLFKKYLKGDVARIAPFAKFKLVIDRHVTLVSDRRHALLRAHGADVFLNENPMPNAKLDKNMIMNLKKLWFGLDRTSNQIEVLQQLTDPVQRKQERDRLIELKKELAMSDDSD